MDPRAQTYAAPAIFDSGALGDRTTLDYVLARYQRQHRMDDATLAAELGVSLTRLGELRRCGRPWPDPHAVQLSRLAATFALDIRAFSRIVLG